MDRNLDFLTPLPPLWTILLNEAYVVIWTFGKPSLPLPCPHGLWMPPNRKKEAKQGLRFFQILYFNTSIKTTTSLTIWTQTFSNLPRHYIVETRFSRLLGSISDLKHETNHLKKSIKEYLISSESSFSCRPHKKTSSIFWDFSTPFIITFTK